MARSTLFQTLIRMARAHREAEDRGVSVETVREERAVRVSRRGVLTAMGLTAAAVTLPACVTQLGGEESSSTSAEERLTAGRAPRIAIVGAGISGLAAALAFSDAGLASKVTVYESSNRIGGRMFSNSDYWDQGQVTEWCGELIDTSHATIRSLAQRYGLAVDDLPLSEPAGSEPVNWFDGGYYSYADLNADFSPVFQTIQKEAKASVPPQLADGGRNVDGTALWNAITPTGVALDNLSLYDWIETRVPGGHSSRLGQLLDAAYSSEYGADTKDQSSLNLVLFLWGLSASQDFEAFGASDERFHIRGGNQQLPVAIAKDLQGRLGAGVIQMNSKLTKVAKQADGTVLLSFAVTQAGKTTTQTVIADAVILTLPFAVLADAVDYSGAGFDARKTRAIKELGRGLCSKLQLQFTQRLWNQPGPWGIDTGTETFSDNGNQCSWHVTRGQPGSAGILNGYTGGTLTVDRATIAPVSFGKVGVGVAGAGIAKLAKTFLAQLEQIFPGITPLYNGKATLSLPHLDPNFRLAYSFWKVGQYQAFAGYERTSQGNIHFGGEHCSVDFQGFMEGGAQEGQRAASEVIAAISAGKLPVAA